MNKNRYPAWLLVSLLLCATGCQKLNFWRNGWKRDTPSKQTASLFPSNSLRPTTEQKRDFMVEMAAMFESQGETDQAIHAYEAVLAQQPHPTAMHRLGVLWMKKGDPSRAVPYFQQAVSKGGENAELLCDMGYAYYVMQRYAEAEQALRRSVELDPRLARAHVNYGLLLARTGRQDDALYAFSRAGLSEAEARNNLAFALMIERRFPEAQAQYNGALQADPHHEPARRGLATLNQVQSQTMVR